MQALYSSASDEWSTPQDFFDEVVNKYGPFDLDAAATADNTKAPKFYTRTENGLRQPWFGQVWLNPPYGPYVNTWLEKIHNELFIYRNAIQVLMLLPARTDTKWFHKWVLLDADFIYFLRGRLHFNNSINSATFPSMLIEFNRNKLNREPLIATWPGNNGSKKSIFATQLPDLAAQGG